MPNKYYQEELQNLRTLSIEFSKRHPALAPMLGGAGADPDVERLLEGVAFLCGLLRGKLDDDFPEIVHGLTDLIFPHYLRPVPSASIVAFTPKPNMRENVLVKAGTSLAATPVDETECVFRTTCDVEVHPLKLVSAETLQQPGAPDRIRLQFDLCGINLSQWAPGKLLFFLGESYGEAATLFLFLTRYTKRIAVRRLPDGVAVELALSDLHAVGFDSANSLIPFPGRSFQGFRLLQEYFIMPEKFLFLELRGWEKWRDRGKGTSFELVFETLQAPVPTPKVKPAHFVLYASPVVNLFPMEAEPVLLDHRTEKIQVRPAGRSKSHFQVFSVEKVTGFAQGSVARREYVPLDMFSPKIDASVYQVIRRRSPLDDSPEVFLSIVYPPSGPIPSSETLTANLICTNGNLPERLQLGDISRQTAESSELLTFRNILPPTSPLDPQLGKNLLWKFLSHLSMNFLSLVGATSLKEILQLYVFPGRDMTKTAANLKRVESILDFRSTPADRLFRGIMMRGHQVSLTARADGFACLGDLSLFGSILDLFVAMYGSINCFSQFQIKETITGETFVWQARLGTRFLM